VHAKPAPRDRAESPLVVSPGGLDFKLPLPPDAQSRSSAAHSNSASGSKPEFLTGVISAINDLQDIFSQLPSDAQLGVNLPQVAVVGSQSSGKSSVLEALVGRDFLPRDNNICTRRPLLLQLQQTHGHGAEWAEFLHQKGRKISDFSEIRKEIEAETNRTVRGRSCVSSDPIVLKVYSPNVLTMTLIDLPGITKVPVDDQPANIEEILTDMTRNYIEQESCIILAVTPGNADVANSEAIKLAQQVDPAGLRTLGVITKIDIMDAGTDVREYLLGERAPKLKLGYVAVVNRSQMDIKQNVSIKDALEGEQRWFQRSKAGGAAYRDIAHTSCGTRVLAHRINGLLKSHIQRMIPSLTSTLRHQAVKLRLELQSLGPEETEESASTVVRRALSRFEREFSSGISGDAPGSHTFLHGGARIANQLKIFAEHLRSSSSKLVGYSDVEIAHAIHNVYGVEGQMLMADKAFRHLLPSLVRSLEDPCQEVVGYVFEELSTISTDALQRVAILKHYPALGELVNEVAIKCLQDAMDPTRKLIANLIAMEAGYINTSHPDFIGGQAALTKATDLVERRTKAPVNTGRGAHSAPAVSSYNLAADDLDKSGTMERVDGKLSFPQQPEIVHVDESFSHEDRLKIETTRTCLESYMEVVVGNLQDSVQKAIMLMLVNSVRDEKLSEYLNMHINRPELLEDLLQEEPSVTQNRKRCKTQLETLTKALKVLDRLPDKMRHNHAQMRKSMIVRE